MEEEVLRQTNFIRNIIDHDLQSGKHTQVITRFPPEPNGYLHIGHVKSICLNFGIARDYGGVCFMRFDDTNPEKEETEYIESILEDVKWLGFDWGDNQTYASDYFDQLYAYALKLIQEGKAYVCHLSFEQIREYRGTLKEPGKNSPYRNRSIEENRQLFEQMKNRELEEGECVLRAKIDMSSPNLNLRDPILYRIKKKSHPMTGDQWCIYPMYDFTHALSDSLEKVTHSLCTLEFEDHRPLYDWTLEEVQADPHPQQIEFSRLFLKYTVTSKRKLNQLVTEKYVDGWDDPRMVTIAGMRRRGFSAEALKYFIERVGISKSENYTEMTLLEDSVRETLDKTAPRVMSVLRPLKMVITNYPPDQEEECEASNHPKDEGMGKRTIPFSREIYIEREDFRESANKKFKRLVLGKNVRLRYAYIVTCVEVIKDDNDEIIEIHCEYDPETKSGMGSEKKAKGVIHWVSAKHAQSLEIRLYDRLFTKAIPDAKDGTEFTDHINPKSLEILTDSVVEPSLQKAKIGDRFQFERQGYFCIDRDSAPEKLIVNRTVTLRDSWAKLEQEAQQ